MTDHLVSDLGGGRRRRSRHIAGARLACGIALLSLASLALVAPASAETVQGGTPITLPGVGVPAGVACMSPTSCIVVGNGIDLIDNGTVVSLEGYHTEGWTAVACPTSTTCLAIGANGSSVNFITNGVVGPPVAATGSDHLGGVACPTATECLAAGAVPLTAKTATGIVATINVTSQTIGPVATLTGTALNYIACAASSSCLVLGSKQNSGASFDASYNPSTSKFGALKILVDRPDNTVECDATQACLVGGSNGHSSLSRGVVIPVPNAQTGQPKAASTVTNMDFVAGIACAAPGICVAVGQGTGRTGSGDVVALPAKVSGSLHAVNVPGAAVFDAIACPSASTCIAAGLSTTGPDTVAVPLTISAS